VKSGAARATVSEEARADAQILAGENAAFAWDLFKALASGEGNLLASPFSVSEALAMVYAGAKGNTASEMEKALHLETLKERTHAAFNALDQDLTAPPARDNGSFRLAIANAAWAQRGHPFDRHRVIN
jgi:serpin B